MITTCERCGLSYDDLYRWTYCPHETFEMHTRAVNAAGVERCCHTVEELKAHMKEE
jgi:hypothetical protein